MAEKELKRSGAPFPRARKVTPATFWESCKEIGERGELKREEKPRKKERKKKKERITPRVSEMRARARQKYPSAEMARAMKR